MTASEMPPGEPRADSLPDVPLTGKAAVTGETGRAFVLRLYLRGEWRSVKGVLAADGELTVYGNGDLILETAYPFPDLLPALEHAVGVAYEQFDV